MNGDFQSLLPAIAAFLLVAVCLVFYVWSLSWLYRDVNRRTNNLGCLMVILIAFFAWPLGLLLWLFLRPPLGGRR